MNRQLVNDQQPNSLWPFSVIKAVGRIKQAEPLNLIWWCLACCVLSATLSRYTSDKSGLVHHVLLVAGSGGCAWFWLLSRSLFRKSQAVTSKAVLLLAVIVFVEAIEVMLPATSSNAATNEFYRVFSNMASLVCIAAIVSVWNETLSGFSKIRSKQERRFRVIFLSMFSLPVAVAVLWLMGAEAETLAAGWHNGLLTFCAVFCLLGSRLAVAYRLRTKRVKSSLSKAVLNESETTKNQHLLADKVLQAISGVSLLTQANLKVSDLAAHIGEQEYKVTHCITNQLQFRNFNHMVNQYRIELAIERLQDAESSHLNIATIAFDCGYNSLGPFNRAFKQHTGKTPSEYRQGILT